MAAWVRRRDRAGRLEILPYQECPSPPMDPALAEACRRAVHVITADGRRLRAGRAALYALGATGNPTLARILAVPPFVWAVELGYLLVARNRPFFARLLFRRE